MNHEGLTKAPILVVLLVAVLFAVANIGIMADMLRCNNNQKQMAVPPLQIAGY